MVKNIRLTLDEKKFFKLLDIKQKLQQEKRDMLKWEDVMMILALNYNTIKRR